MGIYAKREGYVIASLFVPLCYDLVCIEVLLAEAAVIASLFVPLCYDATAELIGVRAS